MADLSHRNHADMNVLHSMVLLVPSHAQDRFAANICGQGLMYGPWWLRSMHWAVCKLRGWNPTVTWYLLFERLKRGFSKQVVDEFARHIKHGKDASDRTSVGGLNQQEVQTTLTLLRHFLSRVDIPEGYKRTLWPTERAGTTDLDDGTSRDPEDWVSGKVTMP